MVASGIADRVFFSNKQATCVEAERVVKLIRDRVRTVFWTKRACRNWNRKICFSKILRMLSAIREFWVFQNFIQNQIHAEDGKAQFVEENNLKWKKVEFRWNVVISQRTAHLKIETRDLIEKMLQDFSRQILEVATVFELITQKGSSRHH